MAEKAIIRAYDGIFLNASSIFVEYIDIIKSPYFIFLISLLADNKMGDFFDIEELRKKELVDITAWYYLREHQNLLYDLKLPSNKMKYKAMDDFLDHMMDPIVLESSNSLNMVDVLNSLYMNEGLVGQLYVWYPYENEAVIQDIKNTLSSIPPLNIVTGPLEEALKNTKQDSTYIFSDYTNINILEKSGKLDFSSLILPEDYFYNKRDGEDIINFEDLAKEHPFKLHKFVASFTREQLDQEE